MTNVEEWTSAETGVGAAIAAGSHLENGIWADFVMAAISIIKVSMGNWGISQMDIIFQCPIFISSAIDRRIIASPIRFISAVIIPAAKDLGVW